ncbi:hypothetical protein [Sphingomonas phyllosphaerae]|uniref:hypothetical protein n=1 Tax=Sphingomonas phyllosphaerae TaxID=257003 RepID=UPI0024130115|nr:hypothetical protein [Sphingomonas phyllosphaerae]
MDLNYILAREQVSLYNASIASGGPARIAHEGLAAAYGRLLAGQSFPNRKLMIEPDRLPIVVTIQPTLRIGGEVK